MTYSSRRMRLEEKRVFKRLGLSLIFVILLFLFIIFFGLPVLVKVLLAISSFKKTASTNYSVDLEIIFPPILNPLPEATNSAKIDIFGFGEKDTEVKIFLNSREIRKVKTDSEGKFQILNLNLRDGENIISAKSVKDDKESEESPLTKVIYKKNEPKLEINSPKDQEEFRGENKRINISGSTDPGNKITINDRFVIVDKSGNFNYSMELNEGENTLTIKSEDTAGNSKTKEIKVKYQKD